MTTGNRPGDGLQPWRSALSLGLVALIGTGLLAAVYSLTHKRIDEQEQRAVLEQLNQLVAPQRYDNSFHQDYFSFRNENAFPGGQLVTAHRARQDGEPVAVVLWLVAPDGYSGPIRLLVGINADGSLAGVRVTGHRETPGLGDAIELRKDDWILDFDSRSLEAPPLEKWTVKRDGGEFDQFTGATITPRAVVMAVRRALDYYSRNRAELFDHPADSQDSIEGKT